MAQKGDRGGGGKPRISLALVPLEVRADAVKVEAQIFDAGTEKTLQFYRDGAAVVGGAKTTKDSKAEFEFKLRPGTTSAKLKAEVVGIGLWREITVEIPPEAKAGESLKTGRDIKVKRFPTQLRIEPTKIGEGRYRLNFFVFDAQDQGIAATIRLSPGKSFEFAGREISSAHDFRVPDTGVQTATVQVISPRLELDVFVLKTKLRQQLTLYGPKVKKDHGPRPDVEEGFWENLKWGLE